MDEKFLEVLADIMKLDILNAPKIKKKKKPKKKKGTVVLPKEISAREQLYRFLLTASPDGLYVAGDTNATKCCLGDKTAFIKEMVQDVEMVKEFCEALRFVKSQPVRSMEPCHHALAVAIKVTESPDVKNILYTEAINITDDCKAFFSLLHHMKKQQIGSPSGWRRFVKSWYKSIPPLKLADMVSNVKGRYGWTHKDAITLAHGVKPAENDVGLKVIIEYIFKGLAGAVTVYGDNPAAKEILEIIKTYEQARRIEDSNLLATLINENPNIGLEMVLYESTMQDTPGIVWKALMKKLPTDELLKSIQTMHTHLGLIDYASIEAQNSEVLAPLLKILKRDEYKQQDVTEALISTLNNTARACPVLTYITLRDYEEGRRRLTEPRLTHYKKTKKDKQDITAISAATEASMLRWGKLSRKGDLVPPSRPVIEALQSLLERSLTVQPKDKKIPGKYMVTIDARSHMFKVFQGVVKESSLEKKLAAVALEETKTNDTVIPPIKVYDHNKNHCFWAEHVNPGKAATVLALYFASHVQDVTVAVFTDEGVAEVSLVKPDGELLSMSDAENKLTSANLGLVSLCSPIEWAKEKKQKYDMFINVLRTTAVTWKIPKEKRSNASNPHDILYDYQKEMALPNAGLVNISLGKLSRLRNDYNQRRILDVFGLDEHVTTLIHTFAGEGFSDKI